MNKHSWTEKQIKAAIKRLRHKKGWLGVADVRSGNKVKAPEYRQLMAILVEQNQAFDNSKNIESPNYKISFDWDNKDQLLPCLFFTPGLLEDPRFTQLPKEIIWDKDLESLWLEAGFTREHIDQKNNECIEQWEYKRKLWSFVILVLQNLQLKGKLEVIERPDWASKALFNWLIAKARMAASMYKAIEVGWSDIYLAEIDGLKVDWVEMGVNATTADDFFLEILALESEHALASITLNDPKLFNSRTTGRSLTVIEKNKWAKEKLAEIEPESCEYLYIKDFAEDYDRAARNLFKKEQIAVHLLKEDLHNILNFCAHQLLTSANPEAVKNGEEWIAAYKKVCDKSRSWAMQKQKPSNSAKP